ncbi:hypothetical protein MKO06_08290 [Gramella sp. GC03-9]|uniref:Uncharacterized protein n=1 Tax=Christiangramia oceanisediminis TaxID=2920386 RepID=A0A9X2I2N7_9FLAO|nr:hypothetical protein [Gramella oceanisediminis]MCP9199901.1 hypothetical protein [Gramella oceanisediminis]
MIGGVFLIFILFLVSQGIFKSFSKKHRFFDRRKMNYLFFYHFFFAGVYYTYALFNNSDSKLYFWRPKLSDSSWWSYFGTSTTFIDFLSYPFIHYFNFNYEMMMVLYSWMGYLGFLFAYLFFRENIPLKIKIFKNIDFLTLILFLPNMHFWTASLGKGAPIFMGLMIFAYAIKRPANRKLILIFSSVMIYFIRPHVFLFIAAGTVLGYMTGQEKIAFWKKLLIYFGMIGSLIFVQDTILGMAGLDESENLVEGFEQFSEDRGSELAKSGSGVNMTNYPLPLKLFTFWFRPLFLDAPGALGLIVSVENLIYLLLFLKILRKDFINFLKKSPTTVKMSLTVFFLASLAMSFVMSNLGIIMRQKSMVMYFLFFVIYYFLAQKKYDKLLKIKKYKLKLTARKQSELNSA